MDWPLIRSFAAAQTPVGYMRDIDADPGIEQRAGENVVVPAPAEPNCVLEPLDFNSAMNSRRSLAGKSFALQHHRLFRKESDWREVIDRVVAALFVDPLVVCMRADGAEQQR